ncbi:hypothetical protein EZV62_012675 [Acer yangbiense]|uniref:RNase H type-1 domain-containing protein n=1 Tax=Acer yangbiense TaxID=1000413 RepID=A0A5C7HYS0_9ROSI|nr:hypothetical protein EZV62_012675 [Acer yangbiense]
MALPLVGCFDFDVGEVFAICEAFVVLQRLGFEIAYVKSDSCNVVNGNPSCDFVLREGNRVAHALAKFACSSSKDKIWLYVCPIFVHSLLFADLS